MLFVASEPLTDKLVWENGNRYTFRLRPSTYMQTAMLVPAICVLPIVLAPRVSHMWFAVLLIGLAAAAHQAWSANIFTFSSDMFPKRAVGSVVGIGGMAGAIGGMLIALVVGQILQRTGSYVPVFLMAGLAYLLALGAIHLLVPTIKPVRIDE